MRRREFLGSAAACGIGLALTPARTFASSASIDWSSLERSLGNRLLRIESPLEALRLGQADAGEVFRQLKNPYWIGDEPALTQTLGWIDAWISRPSVRAVAAESAADVSAAVKFAAERRVPLVIKGGGHSYFGNSNRAGSLLIWTHALRGIEVTEAFKPRGSPAGFALPAVTVGAGTLWGEVYRVVSRDHGRYVQGGGCLTVGTAGFVLGGGFGSFSKQFGTGAANLVEAQVITSDGAVRIANRWTNPDLFFALRGGGGGTFGIVTQMTLRTHPLPQTIGAVMFEVGANDEASWRALVRQIMTFYRDALLRPEWGEQIRFSPGRKLSVSMLCHSRTEDQIRATWASFLAWVQSQPDKFKIARDPLVLVVPGRQLWDPEFLRKTPGLVLADDRPGANPNNLFWATNLGEAGQILNAYQSRWMAASHLHPSNIERLVDALVESSRHWSITLHTNKGLAGGSADAIAATRQTATNPQVLEAFALLICAADAPPAYPGIKGHEPDVTKGRAEAAKVTKAMASIIRLDPEAGCYVSEADYFEKDWKRSHWGAHYPRLAAAKRRYDPKDLFTGHHVVGSK